MKIFALETNERKLIDGFLSANETVIARVKFSAFLFVIHSLKALLYTLILSAITYGLSYSQLPIATYGVPILLLWLVTIFRPWFRAFVDWKFDLVLLTNEEIVIVNQSSIFRVHKQQVNLENITGVASKSQYANLFPFGILTIDRKEGKEPIILRFIPHADRVASLVSGTIVGYQRREAGARGQRQEQVA